MAEDIETITPAVRGLIVGAPIRQFAPLQTTATCLALDGSERAQTFRRWRGIAPRALTALNPRKRHAARRRGGESGGAISALCLIAVRINKPKSFAGLKALAANLAKDVTGATDVTSERNALGLGRSYQARKARPPSASP